ncbi:MAG TPA: hypothetical protein VMQ52_00435 [Candidatus Saccharimonadales bacterium]|jgi:hypothetical protein|nr:hypothetical protein [Candidatus Saccharimonadales bacterium]
MKLLNSDIKQFQALYIKHFNQVLSDDDARAELTLLVRQMEIVYQPITVAQFDKYLTKYVNGNDNYGEHSNSQ